jgi:hypothetical protein
MNVTIERTHQYQVKQNTPAVATTTGYLKVRKKRDMESHGLGCRIAGIG